MSLAKLLCQIGFNLSEIGMFQVKLSYLGFNENYLGNLVYIKAQTLGSLNFKTQDSTD